MRSMIFREARMANEPIMAVLFRVWKNRVLDAISQASGGLQHRMSRRPIATTSIADLTKRALVPPFGRVTQSHLFRRAKRRYTRQNHWGL
jgi:hypothetical protein